MLPAVCAGSFCKAFSRQPKDCPWLATCPEGSVSADLSLGGFLGLAIILVLLWLIYIIVLSYIRYAEVDSLSRKSQSKGTGTIRLCLSLHRAHSDQAAGSQITTACIARHDGSIFASVRQRKPFPAQVLDMTCLPFFLRWLPDIIGPVLLLLWFKSTHERRLHSREGDD